MINILHNDENDPEVRLVLEREMRANPLMTIHTIRPHDYDSCGDDPEDCLELEEEMGTIVIYYGNHHRDPIKIDDTPFIVSKDDPTQWAEGW